jgi:hypothetical protein
MLIAPGSAEAGELDRLDAKLLLLRVISEADDSRADAPSFERVSSPKD